MSQLKIGNLKITGLSDGNFTLPRSIFAEADDTVATELPAALNSFLIEDGSRKILIDTGAGKTFADTLGQLPHSLNNTITNEDDITDIFLTHAHLDHVGGMVDKAGNMNFKNAQIHLHHRELQFWFNDEIYNSVDDDTKFYFNIARTSLTPYKETGMIKTFDDNADMGGGIFAVDLKGHTAGHTGYRLTSGAEQLLIWGDIMHIPSLQLQHPEWHINFDSDTEQGIKTRIALLDEVADDHIKITGMHVPEQKFTYVETYKTGYKFTD